MGNWFLRPKEVARVALRPAVAGSRAVFLVEADTPAEQRTVRELFEALGELADVAPLCTGRMMAFVVQVRGAGSGSAATGLFAKLEQALKQEFSFSLVERSFGETIYQLVEGLAADCGGEMRPLPQCGICAQPEPFPTRVTLRDRAGGGIVEACYCVRCSAAHADPNDRVFLRSLLAADRRGFGDLVEVEAPEPAIDLDGPVRVPACRIAS